MTTWRYIKGSEKDFEGAPDWASIYARVQTVTSGMKMTITRDGGVILMVVVEVGTVLVASQSLPNVNVSPMRHQ